MGVMGSQAVVEMLCAHDVRYVFGLPGDTSTGLYEALFEARHRLAHIMTRDERSAAFMADAYARLSYRPGICEGPSGGGATYIAPGVAEAHYSSIPLICLTTDIPLRDQGRNVLTEMDQPGLFATITKWHAQAKNAARIPDLLRRAFRLATAGRPGAVHLSLPSDVLAEEMEGAVLYGDPACTTYPSYRTRADPRAVEAAAAALLAAQRPVLIAGGGAMIAAAWDEITALAERLALPVGTSINGKGSIAEGHPLSIGVVGENGGRTYANDLAREADLVFFVGCKTDSVTTMHWTIPPLAGGATIIHLDADPAEIGNTYPTAIGLAGDAKLTLQNLLAALGDVQRDAAPRAAELAKRSRGWWAEFAEQAQADALPIKPQRIISELAAALPADYVIAADPGTMTPFTAAYFRCAAGRHIVIPRAFGGLGYALPAVVGAQYARPNATVVGLLGDGSLGMAAGEMETIRRLNLPVILIHFNNRCFGWIKTLQHFYHQDKYYSVDFGEEDCVALAQSFGLRARRIERPGELGDALRQAIFRQEPTFLDVPTAPEYQDVPPVAKWQEAAKRGPGN